MSATVDIRGLKRVCIECGSRFYDMNKRPIICPGCNTEFALGVKVKGRRGRAAAEDTLVEEKKAARPANDDLDQDAHEDGDDTTISLDEAAALEDDDDIDDIDDIDDLDDLNDLDDEDLDDLDAIDDDDD